MRTYILLVCLLLNCLGTIFAGTIDPSVSDQKYLQYGKDFKYVGKLCGTYNDKSFSTGSAVVIKPNYVLTAAHVVDGCKSCKIIIDDIDYHIDAITIPKDYNPKHFGVSDIAVCFTKTPIKLDFYPELYNANDEQGKICCISGYGVTGNFLTGANNFDMRRRAGSNIIEEIQKELLICRASRPNDRTRTSLEFLIASGDSGGGLFIDNKLAGINSCITGIGKGVDSTYGAESGHIRISIYREWILNIIEKDPDLD